MRRAVQQSAKPGRDSDEIVQPEQCKSATQVSTKKFKKIKNSARGNLFNRLRESESKHDTSRTRSVSPASPKPPVEVALPIEKFHKTYSKIVTQMELVKNFTAAKKNETENLLDLRRQLQRADEFSIRFSRNNLYETKRIINDIKKSLVPYPFEKPEQYSTILKKIILAFQSASQALQSYINYVQNPYNLEVPDKINELIVIIADLILCCEHISLLPDNLHIKNDAVKACNELMVLFKTRTPVCEYVELKKADLIKKRGKVVTEEVEKTKKFSMYKPKPVKLKAEHPKKKKVACFLAPKPSKTKKNDKTAIATHEIYTQRLNPWEGNCFSAGKVVKFKPSDEKIENPPEKKPSFRKQRNGTPREVRSQDDDVETMVQTIGDDETISRIGSTPREADEDKEDFKDLLLEAIEELKTGDKADQKSTLDKLLNSIQSFSKPPTNDRVKVYHFMSEDLSKEMENKETEEEVKLTADEQPPVNSDEQEKDIQPDVSPKERRLLQLFKPLKPNVGAAGEGVSRGKVKLKLSEEAMTNANKYKKAFAEYRKNNIMYKRTLTNTPWELVGKVSDRIILDLIKEISQDLENDSMLRELYLSELLEVTS